MVRGWSRRRNERWGFRSWLSQGPELPGESRSPVTSQGSKSTELSVRSDQAPGGRVTWLTDNADSGVQVVNAMMRCTDDDAARQTFTGGHERDAQRHDQ
eukprot:767201-Hanusia_phi.AAC.1